MLGIRVVTEMTIIYSTDSSLTSDLQSVIADSGNMVRNKGPTPGVVPTLGIARTHRRHAVVVVGMKGANRVEIRTLKEGRGRRVRGESRKFDSEVLAELYCKGSKRKGQLRELSEGSFKKLNWNFRVWYVR